MFLRKFAISLVQTIHLVSLLFVLFGWTLPFATLLIIHAAFVPALILHWRTNHNRCALSDIENRLRESPVAGKESEGQFIKSMWNMVFGRIPSDQTLCRITYGSMISAALASVVRLTFQ